MSETEAFSGIRVHVRHMRACGYCPQAGRKWCADNDLSWREFVKSGLPVEAFDRVGDLPGTTLAAAARKEVEDGRRE